MSVPEENTTAKAYMLTHASGAAEEMERLEKQHLAFTEYFGGRLGPAPLIKLQPHRIMELGCGSGTWAIQAANEFPVSQVIAVDQSPPPDQILPANMNFQQADITKKLNFEPESFDAVHCRLVLLYLIKATKVANVRNILQQISRLLKPGGLLLIEDAELGSWYESGGPATRRFMFKVKEVWTERGADFEFGKNIRDMIASLGDFPDIHVRQIHIPFAGNGPEHLKELEQSDSRITMDMYFCWARRAIA
ncbi:S-adenosyl-L-methionine-dependent methyltransferase [Mycena alexandri]|uniref:S-adenosyl-L-methionine-dependent methyltransferase n=1 Tax=Mycena alexandri TaxID=1745969 RepID=A0AAD6WXL0_9AGAR|nr:S-adenosyl-L-methionine-dependent methyltransferase [Mycena alexandri]